MGFFHSEHYFFELRDLLREYPITLPQLRESTPNMTGRPGYRMMEMSGGSSTPYFARTPSASLFVHCFNKVGNRRVFRLSGVGGDHFHCMVEPSPGHIRCRENEWPFRSESVFPEIGVVPRFLKIVIWKEPSRLILASCNST